MAYSQWVCRARTATYSENSSFTAASPLNVVDVVGEFDEGVAATFGSSPTWKARSYQARRRRAARNLNGDAT